MRHSRALAHPLREATALAPIPKPIAASLFWAKPFEAPRNTMNGGRP
jgi:hypothetical protein